MSDYIDCSISSLFFIVHLRHKPCNSSSSIWPITVQKTFLNGSKKSHNCVYVQLILSYQSRAVLIHLIGLCFWGRIHKWKQKGWTMFSTFEAEVPCKGNSQKISSGLRLIPQVTACSSFIIFFPTLVSPLSHWRKALKENKTQLISCVSLQFLWFN